MLSSSGVLSTLQLARTPAFSTTAFADPLFTLILFYHLLHRIVQVLTTVHQKLSSLHHSKACHKVALLELLSDLRHSAGQQVTL